MMTLPKPTHSKTRSLAPYGSPLREPTRLGRYHFRAHSDEPAGIRRARGRRFDLAAPRAGRKLADAAAMAVGAGFAVGNPYPRLTTEVQGVAAQDGFQNGVKGVTVSLNHPPTSGTYAGNAQAYEVLITAPQHSYLAAAVGVSAPTVTGRAVVRMFQGSECIHSLGPDGSPGVLASGNGTIDVPNCDIRSNSTGSQVLQHKAAEPSELGTATPSATSPGRATSTPE